MIVCKLKFSTHSHHDAIIEPVIRGRASFPTKFQGQLGTSRHRRWTWMKLFSLYSGNAIHWMFIHFEMKDFTWLANFFCFTRNQCLEVYELTNWNIWKSQQLTMVKVDGNSVCRDTKAIDIMWNRKKSPKTKFHFCKQSKTRVNMSRDKWRLAQKI